METALCHRCEHRVLNIMGTRKGPRCECEDLGKAISCCYCYVPVAPVVLERAPYAKDDPRPTGSGFFAARSVAVRVYDELPCIHAVGKKGWVMVYPHPPKKRKGGGRSKATKLASSSGTGRPNPSRRYYGDRPNPLGMWARRF